MVASPVTVTERGCATVHVTVAWFDAVPCSLIVASACPAFVSTLMPRGFAPVTTAVTASP